MENVKNTFCIGVDNRFYPSPYVGDLEDLRTVKALRETVGRLETLLEVQPELVCCDMHPKYNSVMVAEDFGLSVVKYSIIMHTFFPAWRKMTVRSR